MSEQEDFSGTPEHQIAMDVLAISNGIAELRWAWIDHKNRDCIRQDLADLIHERDKLSRFIETIEAATPALAAAE